MQPNGVILLLVANAEVGKCAVPRTRESESLTVWVFDSLVYVSKHNKVANFATAAPKLLCSYELQIQTTEYNTHT